LQGVVAGVVFDNAIKKFPLDLDFRIMLVRQVHDFEGMESLREKMYQSIVEDFSNEVECHVALANRHVLEEGFTLDSLEKCVSVFEDAHCKVEKCPKIWEAYSDALIPFTKTSSESSTAAITHLISIFPRAEAEKCISQTLFCKWIELLMRGTQLEEAYSVADRAISKYADSGVLWEYWLKLALTMRTGNHRVSEEAIPRMVDAAVRMLPCATRKDIATVLEAVIHCAMVCGSDVANICQKIGPLVPKLDGHAQWLKEVYLRWVMTSVDLHTARAIYVKVLQHPNNSVSTFLMCIAFEKAQPLPASDQISMLYEKALHLHGSRSVDLWLSLILDHKSVGNAHEVGRLHFRATKALSDPVDVAKLTKHLAIS
jgi:hypothetical protein